MRKSKMKKIVTTAMAVAVTAAAVMGNPMQARAAEFDPVFYAAAYADVAAALGTDAEILYNHYQNYGSVCRGGSRRGSQWDCGCG